MPAGLMLGLSRTAATQFSFLLSIPIITLAGGWITVKLIKSSVEIDWFVLFSGAIISAISAYLCIHFFMKLINRIGMWPFVIYRLLLGVILFALFS
jgi:undecaprenyl-diphosphatase